MWPAISGGAAVVGAIASGAALKRNRSGRVTVQSGDLGSLGRSSSLASPGGELSQASMGQPPPEMHRLTSHMLEASAQAVEAAADELSALQNSNAGPEPAVDVAARLRSLRDASAAVRQAAQEVSHLEGSSLQNALSSLNSSGGGVPPSLPSGMLGNSRTSGHGVSQSMRISSDNQYPQPIGASASMRYSNEHGMSVAPSGQSFAEVDGTASSGVQERLARMTREAADQKAIAVGSLREEQKRLAAVSKELAGLEESNEALRKQIAGVDAKGLREAAAALVAESDEIAACSARLVALQSVTARLPALRTEVESLQPVAAEAAALEEQVAELRRTEERKAQLQKELAVLQPKAVVVDRMRKQVAALETAAADAEAVQAQVTSLAAMAEQLPGLKARYAKMQASAAEVKQLERQLVGYEKQEALQAKMQAQLEALQTKMANFEALKQEVEVLRLKASEASALEQRFGSLMSEAQRLPVLKAQHQKLTETVSEVASLEASIGVLKEKVARHAGLQQQVSILAPKAAGVDMLRKQLVELEAAALEAGALRAQVEAMKALCLPEESQRMSAVAALGLGLERESTMSRTGTAAMVAAAEIAAAGGGGVAASAASVGNLGSPSMPRSPTASGPVPSELGHRGVRGMSLKRIDSLTSPSLPHIRSRAPSGGGGDGLTPTSSIPLPVDPSAALLALDKQGLAVAVAHLQLDASQLSALQEQVLALAGPAAEARMLQRTVVDLTALTAKKGALRAELDSAMQAQLEVAHLEAEVASLGAVMEQKHALEMQAAELEAAAGEVRLLEQLLEGRHELLTQRPEVEAQLAVLAAEAAQVSAMKEQLEQYNQLLSKRGELEAGVAAAVGGSSGGQDALQRLKQMVAALEAEVVERSQLQERYAQLQAQLQHSGVPQQHIAPGIAPGAASTTASLAAAVAALESAAASAQQLSQRQARLEAAVTEAGKQSVAVAALEEELAGKTAALEDGTGRKAALEARFAQLQQEAAAANALASEVATLEASLAHLADVPARHAAMLTASAELQAKVAEAAQLQAARLQLHEQATAAGMRINGVDAASMPGEELLEVYEGEVGRLQRLHERLKDSLIMYEQNQTQLANLQALADEHATIKAAIASLRNGTADVEALRDEYESLQGVEAEIVELSTQITRLAPYAELLPGLRAEAVRLRDMVDEVNRMQADNELLHMQFDVTRALHADHQSNGKGFTSPSMGLSPAVSSNGPIPVSPTAAIEAGISASNFAQLLDGFEHSAPNGAAAKPALPIPKVTAVFERMRQLEGEKQDVQCENEQLRTAMAQLEEQLDAAEEKLFKFKQIAANFQAMSQMRKISIGSTTP